jgi:N-acetylneuraminic acid mutarotase
MRVWGGDYTGPGVTLYDDGGRYDPAEDRWSPITRDGAPLGRSGHTAVWTGEEMLVWGGISEVTPGDFRAQSSGGIYDPSSDQWRPISIDGAPSARTGHLAVWTGNEMLVWGGIGDNDDLFPDGGRYDPASNSWQPIPAPDLSTFAPLVACSVWTGAELLVWNVAVSDDGSVYPDGARFSPGSSAWSSMDQEGAPQAIGCEAVWTGDEMIVTGDNGFTATGGRYDPDADRWTDMDSDGAPPITTSRTAIWADSRLVVWGGFSVAGDEPEALASGGLYDPVTDSWAATADTAIAPRSDHTAVWTGSEMIVWGGFGGHSYLSTGGRFAPD